MQGTEGRYGCAVKQDWGVAQASCDEGHPTDEKVSFDVIRDMVCLLISAEKDSGLLVQVQRGS